MKPESKICLVGIALHAIQTFPDYSLVHLIGSGSLIVVAYWLAVFVSARRREINGQHADYAIPGEKGEQTDIALLVLFPIALLGLALSFLGLNGVIHAYYVGLAIAGVISVTVYCLIVAKERSSRDQSPVGTAGGPGAETKTESR